MKLMILVTGVAGAGKSSVCRELQKRGYAAYDIESVMRHDFGFAVNKSLKH